MRDRNRHDPRAEARKLWPRAQQVLGYGSYVAIYDCKGTMLINLCETRREAQQLARRLHCGTAGCPGHHWLHLDDVVMVQP
jgi:hypothetical protein